MSYEIAQQRIAAASRQGSGRLNLSGLGLTALPAELWTLNGLRVLWLSDNQLTSLPPEIGALRQLVRLRLDRNRLAALPPEFGALTALRELWLHDNQLAALPDTFWQLSQLRTLALGLSAGNKLRGKFSLSDAGNQLTAVPAELGQLSNLQWLHLDNNQLTAVPAGLGQLSNLQTLHLDNNQLTAVPAELGQLSKLWQLTLNGNQQLRYPPEIIEGSTEEILSYLRVLHGANREWISKMVVVGEGGVGKTSLLRRLRGEPFVADEKTTHGIEIKQLPLAHPSQDDVTMLLNTWDFGGQEIYHATHQFFLTNRSLYVLAWNARLGYEQGKLNYWLDTIAVRAPQSPIILVATHTDEREADLPLAELQRSYPRIVGHVEISSKSGDGLDRLRQLIAETAAALPLMGEEWPVTWAKVRHAVRDLAATSNHITPNELTALLDEQQVMGTQARVLTKWLHELGEILFFQDVDELNDIVILNSQWVTEAISRVLESEEVAARDGILSRDCMNQLWRDQPPAMREHFLRLMEQFDLSYRILEDRDKSLVIERVP
jgi:internalin A